MNSMLDDKQKSLDRKGELNEDMARRRRVSRGPRPRGGLEGSFIQPLPSGATSISGNRRALIAEQFNASVMCIACIMKRTGLSSRGWSQSCETATQLVFVAVAVVALSKRQTVSHWSRGAPAVCGMYSSTAMTPHAWRPILALATKMMLQG